MVMSSLPSTCAKANGDKHMKGEIAKLDAYQEFHRGNTFRVLYRDETTNDLVSTIPWRLQAGVLTAKRNGDLSNCLHECLFGVSEPETNPQRVLQTPLPACRLMRIVRGRDGGGIVGERLS